VLDGAQQRGKYGPEDRTSNNHRREERVSESQLTSDRPMFSVECEIEKRLATDISLLYEFEPKI